MTDKLIDNPIINSPFEEPARHFQFDDQGITDKIICSRRISEHLVPIPKPKNRGSQVGLFDEEIAKEARRPNEFINRLRNEVRAWRLSGYIRVTNTTRRLLEHWTNPTREQRLYFCQIEAIETAIYLSEVVSSNDTGHIIERLKAGNEAANQDLFRIAFKMATGSGKTLVMAMLIAWQTLNKFANPQDNRFSDAFLIVTPGITIRDRLRVLLPNDPENYYRKHDLVPTPMLGQLQRGSILVTNYHAFIRKETVQAGKLTKDILSQEGNQDSFLESNDQMVRRVCRALGTHKNIIVINDEAHHCYRHKAEDGKEKLKGEEKQEADKREEQARIWINGLEAIQAKIGIKVVYDLSATPFFLKGSGYPEGTLFGWVVSDFSLTDAIESGIVKVPRVPVADDSMDSRMPKYREIWPRIREQLPKKGRRTQAVEEEPKLPKLLEGAIQSLYSNYQELYKLWEADQDASLKGSTPPVFIVVCNNTNVSRLVYNYLSGWRKVLPDGTVRLVPGLPLFSNIVDERQLARPRTILVDSEQLESGESLTDEFKLIAAEEIEQFKADFRIRSQGSDPDSLTDADILREVMNTVGKPDKLGEQIRCVVSVSMLTEGWDASTVTHILGVRAFGTQLLCEQVIGRGLRRMSRATSFQPVICEGKTEMIECYTPEYAEVYGVPFSFIPCSPAGPTIPVGRVPSTHVRALEEREECEITFPRVTGYRYILPEEKLKAEFTTESRKILSTENLPVKVEMASILGEGEIHTLADLKQRRVQEVDFLIASRLLSRYFKNEQGESKPWYFPELLKLTREWRETCLVMKDNTFPQLLLLLENADDAVEKIYRAIIKADEGEKRLFPILTAYDQVGSTRYVDFDTVQPVYNTRAEKCHISHVVADTGSWEQKVAQSLEDMDEVIYYVKNERLGFTIPYAIKSENHEYVPDFIVRIDDGHGREDLLNLVLEVSGRDKPEKQEKTSTARTMWVPAVNALGTFGRWAFHETSDPWNVMNEIRNYIDSLSGNNR